MSSNSPLLLQILKCINYIITAVISLMNHNSEVDE